MSASMNAGGAGAPVAGTGGGGPNPPPDGGGAPSPTAGQPSGGGGASPSPYRPEGLPDHLYGADDKATIDALYKAFSGFRERAGQLAEPPKEPSGYEFKWSEKVDPFLKDLGDDKLLNGLRDVALKAGLNNSQANGFIDGAFALMLDMDLVDKGVDPNAELAKLIPPEAANLPKAEQDAAVQRRVSANLAYVDGLTANGFTADQANAIKAELAAFPELNALVELMRNGTGARPNLGGSPPAAISKADLDRRVADPRNQFGSASYDGAFAAETTRLYQQLFGDGEGRA